MNKDKEQKSSQNNTQGIVKKLRHKIEHNVIMFSLQRETVLRICVYDERRPSEIYEQVFVGDCLPYQARNMFQSMGEMFEFLQMNFAGLVSLRQKQAIVVDLNKLKIPIKFQLPFRLNVYPIVDQLLQSFNNNTQQMKKQLKQTRNRLVQTSTKYEKQIQQFKRVIKQRENKINELNSQAQKSNKLVRQTQSQLTQQIIKYSQLQVQNQNLRNKINDLESILQSQKEKERNKHSQQFANLLISNQKQIQKNNHSNLKSHIQPSSFIQKIQFKDDQLLKQFQHKKQQIKKPNPFLNGLFTRILPNSNNSLLAKINSNPTLTKNPTQNPQNSRFHRFIEKQPNQELKLNISKKLIKDSDIQELIKFNWSNITRLNLSQNIITGQGLQTLFKIKWPSLKSIVLSANKISDFNLQKLNFLTNAPNLFLIDLNFNNLSSQMFRKLVEFTRNNKSPKIYFNGIKSDS